MHFCDKLVNVLCQSLVYTDAFPPIFMEGIWQCFISQGVLKLCRAWESGNENKIIIDKYAVSEELKNKFNINDMSEFDNTFVQSNSCGIKSYTYKKDAYELEINPCKDTYDYVLSKVVKAEKEGNHLYL